MFTELKIEEMQNTEGGSTNVVSVSGLEILGAVAAAAGIYMCVREMAETAGRNAAYRDLGM